MNIRKNVLIHFLGKLIPALANLVIMIAGLRLLGKSVFGEYSLQFNSVMIISSLGIGWLQQAILRFLPGTAETESKGIYLFLALCSGVIVTIITILFGYFYFNLSGTDLATYAVFSFLFSLFSVQLSLMQASFNPMMYALGESVYYLIAILLLLGGILFLGMNSSSVYFIAMMIALLIVEIAFFTISGKHQQFNVLSEPRKQQFLDFFSYGFTLTVWIMIATLYNYLDRFLIEHFQDYEKVGLYSAVYDLVFKVSGFLSLPVLLAYHPAIAHAWNGKDINHAKALIKKSIGWEAITLVVMFVILYLMLSPLFLFLFNINDAAVHDLFIPLSLSAGLWQVVLLLQKPLEFGNKRKIMIAGIICALSLNAIMNCMLIPEYGFKAAAWTTLGCTTLYVVIVFFAVRRYLRKITTFAE